MAEPTFSALLVRAGARVCALPVESVLETMRPLPISTLPEAPPFVSGVAVIRGEPVPVVDLHALLGGGAPGVAARFVTVRAGARSVALAVERVLGIEALTASAAAAPPLLSGASAAAVEALASRDGDLLVVLSAARLVPDEVHRAARALEGLA